MILKYFPEATKISSPEGGYLIMGELDKKVDSLELYKACLEEKITIIPGPV
jgi:DNA-binding transcriptional MocR family regulator